MGSKTKSKKSRISKKKPYKKRVNKKKITIKNRMFRKKHYRYKKNLRTRKYTHHSGGKSIKKSRSKPIGSKPIGSKPIGPNGDGSKPIGTNGDGSSLDNDTETPALITFGIRKLDDLKRKTLKKIKDKKLDECEDENAKEKVNKLFELLEKYMETEFMKKLNESGIPDRLKLKVYSGILLSLISLIPAAGPLAVAVPKQLVNATTTYKEFEKEYDEEKKIAEDIVDTVNSGGDLSVINEKIETLLEKREK